MRFVNPSISHNSSDWVLIDWILNFQFAVCALRVQYAYTSVAYEYITYVAIMTCGLDITLSLRYRGRGTAEGPREVS